MVGEGAKEPDLLVAERPRISAAHEDHTDRPSGPEHGAGERAAIADHPGDDATAFGGRVGRLDVRHMHDVSVEDRAARNMRPVERNRIVAANGLSCFGPRAEIRSKINTFAVGREDGADHPRAQSNRAFDDVVEDRLRVRLGTRDDTQHFRRRRLLLEGLP